MTLPLSRLSHPLSRRDLREFVSQLFVFGVIAGGLLILNVAQAWLNLADQAKARDETED